MDPKLVIALLRKELALQRRHVAILREQQNALVERDDPRFNAALAMYEQFCHELEAHANERKILLGDPVPALRPIIQSWDAADAKVGIGLIDTIRGVVERVRALALQNNQMVANHLMYVQFMLSVMVRTHNKSRSYAPVKRTQKPPQGEHIFINQVA